MAGAVLGTFPVGGSFGTMEGPGSLHDSELVFGHGSRTATTPMFENEDLAFSAKLGEFMSACEHPPTLQATSVKDMWPTVWDLLEASHRVLDAAP